MSRPAKGPRLWRQPAYRDEQAVWCVRDGKRKVSTGALAGKIGSPPTPEAEAFLVKYLQEKAAPRPRDRDPSQVLVASVLEIYLEDKAENQARPDDTKSRLRRIALHFNGKTLDYLNMTTCEEYVTARGKQAAARRELEDLRSAVRYHWKKGLCTVQVPVVLPDKGESRERWLTRKEAALLLRTTWRRKGAKHIARFILVGLYTGTRSGAICGAAMAPTEGRGWVDTDHGVFYRRAIGKKKTNKRQPSIRIPPQLLTHIRRWKTKRISKVALVEWNHQPVIRVSKGFAAAVAAAKLKNVSPHILRHTAITWQAQEGVPPHEICGFFGITMKMFEDVYGHHHPDFQSNAVNALNRRKRPSRQLPDRNPANLSERKVIPINSGSS